MVHYPMSLIVSTVLDNWPHVVLGATTLDYRSSCPLLYFAPFVEVDDSPGP